MNIIKVLSALKTNKGVTMRQLEYDELIPNGVVFNLKEIQNMKILKISMAKKLISNGQINIIKIGNKVHVARSELIRFLEEHTISTTNNIHFQSKTIAA
jgi:hypothetical protein